MMSVATVTMVIAVVIVTVAADPTVTATVYALATTELYVDV